MTFSQKNLGLLASPRFLSQNVSSENTDWYSKSLEFETATSGTGDRNALEVQPTFLV